MALELLTPFTKVDIKLEEKTVIANKLVLWGAILTLFTMRI